MRIEHVALWVADLERMRAFYEAYFDAKSGDKYTNEKKGFSSYFLTFENGARLEIMHRTDVHAERQDPLVLGWAHLAISVGSEALVNDLTEHLREDGYEIIGVPRWTGDGYYESVVADPENNQIEITI
ncbi:MAG: VOC family protein [Saprospiraceae bacterium]|nr:VOC family protein [Saprospiraceae bacterium]